MEYGSACSGMAAGHPDHAATAARDRSVRSRTRCRDAIDADIADLRRIAGALSDAAGMAPPASLAALAAPAGGGAAEHAVSERALDAAAMDLRRWWLAIAHRSADATMKSPCGGAPTRVASGRSVSFGYERDLDAGILERRGARYAPPPAGWSGAYVVCRSGQTAMSCALHLAVSRWGRAAPLATVHAGAYFETASLLDAWPARVLNRRAATGGPADLLLAEPVACDGQFSVLGPSAAPRARRAVILDTTLCGPAHDAAPWAELEGRCPVLIVVASGLKLDQEGLELANAGIVRIFTRDDSTEDAGELAASLRAIRGLTGGGLTLDELSALSAPWFMDREFADAHASAVFENNAALAARVGRRSGVFRGRCHPSLESPDAAAPFCALRLRDEAPGNYDRLLDILRRESARRELVWDHGGSFGFRGHRVEIVNSAGPGSTFLRVAMGRRAGHSLDGLCGLIGEIASRETFGAVDRAYRRDLPACPRTR